jgi:hypothetical protein
MKTKEEVLVEAQLITSLGREYQAEHISGPQRTVVVSAPRILMVLDDPVERTWVTKFGAEESDEPSQERYVAATVENGELVFHLMERDAGFVDIGHEDDSAFAITSSFSAYDVLRVGYELAESERLAAAVEPYAETAAVSDDPAHWEKVTELAGILELDRLPVADRLRAKAEIMEFLEGRLGPSEFIAHAVERQYSPDTYRANLSWKNELRFTVGEP